MQGVVFNAHYLAYADDAFGAWVETVMPKAMDYVGNDGSFDVMVKKAVLTWHGAVRFGDTLDLDCAASRWGRSSFDVRFVGSGGRRRAIRRGRHLRQCQAGDELAVAGHRRRQGGARVQRCDR